MNKTDWVAVLLFFMNLGLASFMIYLGNYGTAVFSGGVALYFMRQIDLD